MRSVSGFYRPTLRYSVPTKFRARCFLKCCVLPMGFASIGPLASRRRPPHPVLVHRLAPLLHASFRPHLAVTPLRFANPSPPSGWVEDLHLQAVNHARRTRESPDRFVRASHFSLWFARLTSRFWRGRAPYYIQANLVTAFADLRRITLPAQCSPALSGTLPVWIREAQLWSPHCALPQPKHRSRAQQETSGPTRLSPCSQTPGAVRSSAPLTPGRKTFLSLASPPTLPGFAS